MCGIAGFIDFKKDWTAEQGKSMIHCISHRGPDGDGTFFHEAMDYRLALGHKRLSIIDLSAEANQPFYSADGRYVIVFNGEMYNYKEVAAQYGIQARTSSDTEILVEAFSRKGVECIHDFNGMFALAIWDNQEEKLYLLRDRFGVKPLLYFQSEGKIAFASELKALFTLPIPRKINMQALQDYLFLEYVPGTHTIVKNCHKLPKGHYMTIDRHGVQVRPYYSFFDKIKDRPLAGIEENKALEHFDDLLGSAVKYRQVSDVPVGAFLSGGTDSSLICSLFQKQNQQPIRTFTIGFDVADYDETKYAGAVARELHTSHSEFHLDDRASLSIVDKLVSIYDEPFAASSCIPSYLVCKEARKVVTVAMSGDGGDELFMGYGYYHLYAKLKRVYAVAPALGRQLLKNIFTRMGSRYDRASRMLTLPSKDLLVHLWSEQQYMFSAAEISALTDRSYQNSSVMQTWERVDKLDLSDSEKISLFDIEEYLAQNLLYKIDSASMANSLEVRNPYLDYRLMEFSFNLPENLKVRNGEQKYLMKRLLERYIPRELVYRRKWGFPAPLDSWLQKDLAYLIDKWLNRELIAQQGIFNPDMIVRYVKAFRDGKRYHYKRLWSIIIFQMWYHKYIVGYEG